MQTRIAGYDFTRSLALFGLVVGAFDYHLYYPDFYLLDTFSQGWVTTTFLVLGGIGMSLLRQRDQRTNPARRSVDSRTRLIKRAASLLVVGICCNLIWQTYFLCFYSICIAIGALLLTASNRWLWALAFIFVLIWVAFAFWVFFYPDVDVIENFETLQDSDPWTVEGAIFRLSIYNFHSIFFWARFAVDWYVVRTVECALPSGTKGVCSSVESPLFWSRHVLRGYWLTILPQASGSRLMRKLSTGYYSCRFSCRFTSFVCVESLLQSLVEASC